MVILSKNWLDYCHKIHNSYNIGMSDLPDIMHAWSPQAQRLRTYIFGESQMSVLQLICNIPSGKLKADQVINVWFENVYREVHWNWFLFVIHNSRYYTVFIVYAIYFDCGFVLLLLINI